MGKETSTTKNAKSRSYKPYDASNSFVGKVANRVSSYLGSFFNASETNNDSNTLVSSGEGNPGHATLSSQSSHKRIKIDEYETVTSGENNHLTYRRVASSDIASEAIENRIKSHHSLQSEPSPGPSGVRTLNTTEPVAGPSGISRRLEPIDVSSDSVSGFRPKFLGPRFESSVQKGRGPVDDKSESSESTSGCSSLVPQADRMTQSAVARRKSLSLEEKLGYARQLKISRSSVYLNRSIPVHVDTPRPSRTPAFDVSAYGSPILSKSSVRDAMLSSPFYAGHTTYGGASARRNSVTLPHSRPQIPVKPANTPSEDLSMSHTARRILAALEEFSTPLADARRIPTPAPLASKRRALEPSSGNAAKLPALAVPTVADLIKMRLEQIQESTAAARQVVVEATPLRQLSPPRRLGKIVTKLKDRDKPPPQSTIPPALELPNLPLPISTLPKFDIQLPQPLPLKQTSAYTFAAPIEVDSSSSGTSLSTLTNFTFSQPVSPEDWIRQKSSPLSLPFTPDALKKLKKKPIEASSISLGAPPSSELKTGSVMDILGKKADKRPEDDKQKTSNDFRTTEQVEKPIDNFNKFKPPVDSWNCDMCLVNNMSSAVKCIACETDRPSSSAVGNTSKSEAKCLSCSCPLVSIDAKCLQCNMAKTRKTNESSAAETFGDKFKPAVGSWTCSDCWVNNSAVSTKCVACGKCNPGSDKPSEKIGFGDKFKPPSDTWSCSTCMVNNTSTAKKCVACDMPKAVSSAPKALGFDNTFKPATGSWSCSTCLVSNTSSSNKCVACETPKPESNVTTSSQPFGFGDFLKKTSGKWECSVCLVRNDEGLNKCAACETQRPNGSGASSTTESSTRFFCVPPPPGGGQFKFGIDEASDSTAPVPNGASKLALGINSAKPTFTFGIPPAGNKPDLFINDASGSTMTESKLVENDMKSKPFSFSAKGLENATESITSSLTSKESTPMFTFGLPAATASSTIPNLNAFSSSEKTSPTFDFNGSVVNNSKTFGAAKPVTGAAEGNLGAGFPTSNSGAFGLSAPSFFAAPAKSEVAASSTTFLSESNVTNSLSSNVFSFGAKSALAEPKPQPVGTAPSGGFNFSAPNQATIGSLTNSSAPFRTHSSAKFPCFRSETSNITPLAGGFQAQSTTFGSSAAVAPQLTFGAPATPTFGGFGAPSGGLQNPFSQNNSGSVISFGTPTPTPVSSTEPSFGSTPTSLQVPAPFQFGANSVGQFPSSAPTTPANFSLTIPSSFNFTGGETPSFSATPTTEPKRRIIKARRFNR